MYMDRDRKSDGWLGDTRHSVRKSDHNPDKNGIVRALDIDADLGAHKEEAYALVEKIRKCAKRGDKRIKYIIYDGKIMSPILGWKRRKYTAQIRTGIISTLALQRALQILAEVQQERFLLQLLSFA